MQENTEKSEQELFDELLAGMKWYQRMRVDIQMWFEVYIEFPLNRLFRRDRRSRAEKEEWKRLGFLIAEAERTRNWPGLRKQIIDSCEKLQELIAGREVTG